MHTCHLHKDETHAGRHAHQAAQERSCRPKSQDAYNTSSKQRRHVRSISVFRKEVVCLADQVGY